MGSGGVVDRQTVTAIFDALDAAADRLVGLDFDALTTPEWLVLLGRCEKVRRRLPVAEHQLINNLARQASAEELGGKLSHAIADWALTSRTEASRRSNAAADLGPRRALTGEPIAPVLAGAAAAQCDGTIGAEHIAVIRRFCRQLPGWVDQATRERAEAQLARQGGQVRPEQLSGLAATIADRLNPDGTYRDEDRARRRALMLGSQQADGMSELRARITPSCAPPWKPCWPSWPPRACATPNPKPPVWTAVPVRPPSTPTPAQRPNALMTGCWPGCAPCWRPESWVSTTAYPRRSS